MDNTVFLGNTVSMSGFRSLLNEALASGEPYGWSFSVVESSATPYDATLEIASPKSGPNVFRVLFKRHFEPRNIDTLKPREVDEKHEWPLLIVTTHLSARTRALLKERQISFLDTTGNFLIVTGSILLDRPGADKAPKGVVEAKPRRSLRGPITGRIVRALCDRKPPLKVREIAMDTNTNPGNVSRVLELLERERLISRENGAVSYVDWEQLLMEWSGNLAKDRIMHTFLEPRGIIETSKRLRHITLRYAITGAFASAEIAAVSMPISMDVYVNDIEEARAELLLHHSERVGNVRLIQAFDRVVFERTRETGNGLILASPTQIAADMPTLLTRSKDEYQSLLQWMKNNEPAWRS